MLNKVDEAIHAVSDHLKCLAESDLEQEFSRMEAIAKETEALEKLVASRAEFYKARYPKTEEDVALLRSVILEGCTILDFVEKRERALWIQTATPGMQTFKYSIINSFKAALRGLLEEADVDITTRTYLLYDSKPSDSEKALAEEQEQNEKAKKLFRR